MILDHTARYSGDMPADALHATGPEPVRRTGGTTAGPAQGRKSAWAAFVLGVIVSVAANVAHTWHPATATLRAYAAVHHGSVAGWRPGLGAQLAAAFYPCALLLTIELLTRVRWPAGAAWVAARFGGTGVVAAVAAVVSYRHMAGLLAAYGEDGLTAMIGPLAVDGLMVVASFALLAIARSHSPAPMPPAALPDQRERVPAPGAGTTMTDVKPTSPQGRRPDAPAPDRARRAARPPLSMKGVIGRKTDGAAPAAPPAAGAPHGWRDAGDTSGTAAGAEANTGGAGADGRTRRTAEPRRPAGTRARASALLAQRPDMTGKELAHSLGISERYGQRIAAEVRRSMAAGDGEHR